MPELTGDADAGLWALFVLVLSDSLGVPAPGDSALIVAGGLAADGRLWLPAVIGVAWLAAVLGDAIAFEAGRHGGRRILEREGRFVTHRRALLARADRFYARHGLFAVFFLKFVPGVRGVSAVAAGAAAMRRISFTAVNALACACWTTATASVAYAVGPTGALLIVGIGLVLSVVGFALRAARRRPVRAGSAGAAALD
jgi:membrane protein DedA with SNARE-associated domain